MNTHKKNAMQTLTFKTIPRHFFFLYKTQTNSQNIQIDFSVK